MASYTCNICGKKINVLNSALRFHNGEEIEICSTCFKHTEKHNTAALAYLQEKANGPAITSEALSYVQDILQNKEFDSTPPDSKKVKSPAETTVRPSSAEYNTAPESSPSGAGLVIDGIIFLIISIILFSASIIDVDGFKVANIQLTVFSAACFIIANVCFTCRYVISVLKKCIKS